MYDLSKHGGLASLARTEHAKQKESAARCIRTHANMHSTEYKWVQDSYKTAERLEKEAEVIMNNE